MGRPSMKKHPFKMRIREDESYMPAIMKLGDFVQKR